MIDSMIWSRLAVDDVVAGKQALAFLAEIGILEMQAQHELSRLGTGDPTTPVEEIAKEVARVRADTRGLLTIHAYGLQLAQEMEI